MCSSFFPINGHCQSSPTDIFTDIQSILDSVRFDTKLDAERKSQIVDSLFLECEKRGDKCSQVKIRSSQAIYLDEIGIPDSALTQLYWAIKTFQPTCDSTIMMSILVNLTNVYLSLSELEKVDSVGKLALAYWNPKWSSRESRLAILNNLGISQAIQDEPDEATKNFRIAYHEAIADKNINYIQKALINLGTIKGMSEDFDSAYYFLNIAAKNARDLEDVENYMGLLINMANVNTERGKYVEAEKTLDTVYKLALEQKHTEKLMKVQQSRADLFASINNYKKAYQFLDDYVRISEDYLNEERVKAVTEMMEKYESEKKARQIQELELDKLDATLKNERLTHARNRFLYVGIVVLLVAVGIATRLQYVHKSRAAIQKEKDISEGLLLNILPAAVADELKEKGFAEAMLHDVATILFSDFKGFTTLSEQLSAQELVQEINTCFKTFDHIMTKYGIEKIKTIGDSYMAAAGIPIDNTASVLDIVHAALDMQAFIISRKEERDATGLPSFQMRVGLHTGSVVAGIVGVKKFQYDLWGDTVNTASRMESSGEIDEVNISEATYLQVKDAPGLSFTPRGKIYAKGKGEMSMYFVSRQLSALSHQSLS
jgi:class 3 adenylate cyclase